MTMLATSTRGDLRRYRNLLKLGTGAVAMVAASWAAPALAQSTASQLEEIIVTGTREQASVGGLIRAEQAAKARSTITQEYISSQMAGQSVLDTINLLPGVNFTNSDPYGNSGGNIRMRGFDGNRVSLQFDGIPLNDTGNYAVYTNQQLDSEVIDRVNVNLGSTDVDSPTGSATGGTINYVTRLPSDTPDATGSVAIGSFAYRRVFASADTGELGPYKTKSFIAASYTDYNKFKGPGELEKKQVNGRIYQPLKGDDFVSLAFHYNENRNTFYRNISRAQFNQGIEDYDYNPKYITPTVTPGTVDVDAGANGDYYEFNTNPSNTGNIRAQSKFSLSDSVTLTFDPYIQYTLANGGGTSVIYENDWRLIGGANGTAIAKGVDLNGDCTGVIGGIIPLGSSCEIDQVRLYRPNNTNTWRPGLTSSVLWEINDNHRLRFGYTLDYGRHRQTGEYTYISADGQPNNLFGGKEGTQVIGANGLAMRGRDRYSVAELNQLSAEYTGKFLDERLRLTAGVRAPFFKRELNQFCYTVQTLGTSNSPFRTNSGDLNSNQYCAASVPTTASGIILQPYSATKKYDDVLPNLSVAFKPAEDHLVYASYAEGISLPRTDSLYGLSLPDADPETTKTVDVGYRYQSGIVIGSVSAYYTRYYDRIKSSYDEDLRLSLDRNIGREDMMGVDAEVGVEPIDNLTLYLSTSYIDTEVKENIDTGAGTVALTKGKEESETPKWTVSTRAQYKLYDFTFGAQMKYVGKRWTNDVNTEYTPSYTVVDLDLRYDLDSVLGTEGSSFQINVKNVFDRFYMNNISTAISGTRTASVGAPRTVQGSLRLSF
ncbi:TonB-dependent receptor [Oleisolibacter albus]|uniref:TonB-dependent receptor n=1 Tax=Oleisolibacter albus TaxID=2171757 RepID=UPI00195F69F3|nr:TonB-dependent receptor [Oleisolibacter albus]